MSMYISGVTEYVQAPHGSGYEFSASVVVAGLALVPLSVSSLAASRSLPWLIAHAGSRALLPLGSLVVAGAFFALFHASLWQAFVMMVVLGVGIGSTSAAIPGLIVRAVPDNETGSAMGFYQVVRYVGFSLGSALTASIIASHTPSGQHLPTETAYTLTLWIAVVVCIAAAAVAWIIPARGGTPPNPIDKELVEEDAELGPAGFIGLTPAPGRGEVPSPTLDTRAATLLRRAGPPRDFLSSFTKRRFGRDNRGTEAQVAHAGH